jgi:hypothetical protein
MDMELVIRQLHETATVMANIQARQAEVLKGHSEWLEAEQAWIVRHEKWLESQQAAIVRHEQMMAIFDAKMVEIEDKLNGLIGFVDDLPKRKPE